VSPPNATRFLDDFVIIAFGKPMLAAALPTNLHFDPQKVDTQGRGALALQRRA